MRSCNLTLPLEVELNQVSTQDEQQDEEHEQDDELQRGKQKIRDRGGGKLLSITHEELYSEEQNDKQDDNGTDNTGALGFGFSIL